MSAYGAQGDGSNEEYALQRAIDAAGDGGSVVFESDRVYTICKMLRPRPNQLWQPSGEAPATLRRCDSPVTTLIADALPGATSVAVASTAGFEPGMWVSPVREGGNDYYAGEFAHHPVYEVSPGLVQFHNGLGKAYSAGDKLVTSFAMVRDANGVTFEGLVFDGNAAGNDHFVSWARHSSLWMHSLDSTVKHSAFIDSQGDAITVQGLDNLIEYNTFTQLNGAALHFSAANQTIVRNNHMIETNLQAQRVVHAEAAATWSLGNQDILIENNCIQDISEAAFGHILVHGNNYGADIRDNQVCRVNTLMTVVTNSDFTVDLLLTGNSIDKGGRLNLVGNNSTLSGIEISGNRITDTAISTKNTRDLTIENNLFTVSDDADFRDELESPNNKLATIVVRGGDQISITGNELAGGRKGIQVHNADTRTANVTVANNTVLDNTETAILVGHLSSIDSSDPDQSDFAGVEVRDNTVDSAVLGAGHSAIELGRRARFSGNCVSSNQFGVRVHGYPSTPSVPAWDIVDNRVSSASTSFVASTPFTYGPLFLRNTADQGISSALLSSNPGSEPPTAQTVDCF
ncbi:MAG: right-handed parallel beta-helix repeat-containing protein [Pseudomonadota bacterium]